MQSCDSPIIDIQAIDMVTKIGQAYTSAKSHITSPDNTYIHNFTVNH